jgi:nucleotide-binding universal stress UspA family protein
MAGKEESMHATKILFPTDFSELSQSALAHAAALAHDTGAKLLIAHVEEPPQAYGGAEAYYALPEFDDESLRERLLAVVPPDPDVQYDHRLLIGDPAAEIVHLAAREQVDLIVMGTHGRTGLMRLIMGSVAEAVVRRATCPVLTLKHPQEALIGYH